MLLERGCNTTPLEQVCNLAVNAFPPPTSLLCPRLRVPGVSPENHSPCEAMCAQIWGLQRKSLPREETAAVAAETQPKALVWGQFQHQDGQDFKRRTCIYYGMKHNAHKRNP